MLLASSYGFQILIFLTELNFLNVSSFQVVTWQVFPSFSLLILFAFKPLQVRMLQYSVVMISVSSNCIVYTVSLVMVPVCWSLAFCGWFQRKLQLSSSANRITQTFHLGKVYSSPKSILLIFMLPKLILAFA